MTIRLDPSDHTNSGSCQALAPPLGGYWWETERQVCVPLITSASPKKFMEFLAAQEAKGKAVVFPTVISLRLDRLLRHRGYVDSVVYADYAGEDVDCLTLRPELLAILPPKDGEAT